MTPSQIKKATTQQLVENYKNKARCYHSRFNTAAVYREIQDRLGRDKLSDIRLGLWHIETGDNIHEFDAACDKLIKELSDNFKQQKGS